MLDDKSRLPEVRIVIMTEEEYCQNITENEQRNPAMREVRMTVEEHCQKATQKEMRKTQIVNVFTPLVVGQILVMWIVTLWFAFQLSLTPDVLKLLTIMSGASALLIGILKLCIRS